MGLLEGEERRQKIGNLFEKITENFPILVKERDIEAQEAQRIPNKMNPKRSTPRHIIIKMQNVKEKESILQSAREKQIITHKGAPIRWAADFSVETSQARIEE